MAFCMEAELQCQICLDIYKNPVILPCSHSFCKQCLESWWQTNMMKDCPICKEKHLLADITTLPSNLVLRNLCEAFLEQKAKEAATPVCSLHSEKLKLFCLDHEEPVCLICQASKAHSNHRFKPIDEAVQDYKEELQESLKHLKKKVQQFQVFHTEWVKLGNHIQIQAKQTEKQVQDQFAKLHDYLDKEEKARLAILRKEEKQKRSKITEKIDVISKEIQALTNTISATEKELRAEDIYFLKKYKEVVERVQRCPPLHKPQIGSGALIDVAKHLGNLGLNVWEKMKDMFSPSPFILDRNTAGTRLVLSEDLMQVSHKKLLQELPDNPERLSCYCVLGTEGFSSGTHSWEVEVGNNQNWALGVATVTGQKGRASLSQVWRLCFCEGSYSAETKSGETSLLLAKKQLQRVEASLDIRSGKLSFLDAETHTNVYTFTDNFTGYKLYPYIFTEDAIPLKIIPSKITVTVK